MAEFDASFIEKPPAICITPGCLKPANMSCPTCLKLGLPPSLFCEQQCFKDYWHEHKDVHRWNGDAVAILREANGIIDHLSTIGVSSCFPIAEGPNHGETEGVLRSCKTFALTKRERDSIWDLLEVNVRSFYEATWGWDREAKLKELFDPAAFFLVLQSATGELIAFSMFKFSWDDEEEPEYPVLFCYELQIAAKYQGIGIGRKLMNIELEIAKKRNLWKTMLTCFKINTRAMQFYGKIGFGVDVNSPSFHGYPTDYEILSDKPTRRS